MIYPIELFWLWLSWPLVVAIVIAWEVHDDSSFAAFFTLIVGTIVFILFSPFAPDTGRWIWAYRGQIPIAAAIYFAVGSGWGVIKWQLYVLRKAREYGHRMVSLRKEFTQWGESGVSYTEWLSARHDFPPSPSKNRSRIVTWMVWWPFSFLGSLFSDLIRRGFDWIYDELATLLGYLSRRAFRSFDEFNVEDLKSK